MTKTAVYTICKNEISEVQDWLDATKDADIRVVVDTGSTDDTDKLLIDAGVQVFNASIQPWRFDDALNTVLALIPSDVDVCFRLDMDERPHEGWREAIEKEFTDDITLLRYPYHWSPKVSFYCDRIHKRHGYRWKGATHEGLVWRGEGEQNAKWIDSLEVSHYQKQKSRPNDLPLLKEAVTEYPNDSRLCLYYARELAWRQHNEEAVTELRRYVGMSPAACDAAYAYRLLAGVDADHKLEHLKQALTLDASASNELALADYWYDQNWELCHQYVINAINKISDIGNWNDDLRLKTGYPYDIATIAAWNVGDVPAALSYVKKALEFTPDEPRLLANLELLEATANAKQNA